MSDRDTAAKERPDQDGTDEVVEFGDGVRILTLVSTGHAISSFYVMCLPPLLPFFKAEFSASYTLLGFLLSLRSIVSGALQMPMGILADRFGGKNVLTIGLFVMSGAFGALALAPSIWWCMPLMLVFGAGLSTMRPSNYVIIAASIPPTWMGRAFSINVFGGNVGHSIAPPIIIALSAWLGWRAAVIIGAALGLAASLAIISQWRLVRDDAKVKQKHGGVGMLQGMRMLASRTTALFFMFYFLNAVSSNGINSFFMAAVSELHATPLAVASSALTGYLVASAAGVLLGGYMVDITGRYQLIAASALIGASALIALLGAVSLPVVLLVAVMILAGTLQGMIRPARDLMLRGAMPREAFGRAAGMVTTGASIGSASSPLLFGWILDHGQPQLVFYIIGCLMLAVAATAVAPKGKVRLD